MPLSSLVFEDKGSLAPPKSPGVHALVVGVNDYPHKPSSGGKTWGNLTSPVPSAIAFARWLYESHRDATTPLRSLRVLLSGSRLDLPDGGPGRPPVSIDVPAPTFDNAMRAFTEWFQDCDGSAHNTAMFYFCGHGCEPRDICLLAEDAGAPVPGTSIVANPWDNFVNFQLTYDAMGRNRAKVQLYFLDACRDVPPQALQVKAQIGRPLRTPETTGVATMRDAPIYLAAPVQGYLAGGAQHQVSDFTRGLIECLNRFAASSNESRNPWVVNTSSLRDALAEYMTRQTRDGVRLSTGTKGDGSGEAGKVHEIHGNIEVLTNLYISPPHDPSLFTFEVASTSPGAPPQPPLTRGAAKLELPHGEYDFSLTSTAYHAIQAKQVVNPPVQKIRLPGNTQPLVPRS